MTRVASLYLPQLAIERLRKAERPARLPEPAPVPIAPRFALPIDDNPGACSVPKAGGWRPGARWARDGALGRRPTQADIDAMPAHQRPTMREMGRRSEAAEHVFKAMPADDEPLTWATLWGKPTILIMRTGQRDVVTAACPVALELGLRPGMAAAHARALVTDLEVRDAQPEKDYALLDRLARSRIGRRRPASLGPTASGSISQGRPIYSAVRRASAAGCCGSLNAWASPPGSQSPARRAPLMRSRATGTRPSFSFPTAPKPRLLPISRSARSGSIGA